MALTPASRHPGLQVSPLVSLHLPGIPPPTTLCAPVSLYTPQPAYRTCFGLRLEGRGSSPHTAESSSSSCGLPVRLQLLSTPPHGDAVTFGYRALAYPDTDFHCADVAPSRAHSLRPSGSFLNLAATPRRPQQPAKVFELQAWGQAHMLLLTNPCAAHQPSRQIRVVGRSTQRHQGGARRAGDSRGAECSAALIPQAASQPSQQRSKTWKQQSQPPDRLTT